MTTITNVVLQLGDQPYEVTVATGDCGKGGRRLPGDCNLDGSVNVADPLCLLGFLFLGDHDPVSCGDAAGSGEALLDWSGDGRLSVTDAVIALRYLFLGGPPHALGTECIPTAGCPAACGG